MAHDYQDIRREGANGRGRTMRMSLLVFPDIDVLVFLYGGGRDVQDAS
jgi:hypothetical protein